MSGRHMAFPFHIDSGGRPGTPMNLADHIRGEIIQLLLTNPGERPFLPSFGGGLYRLVFEGNDEVTAGLAKARISRALNHWLGHRIEIQALDVEARDATMTIDLRYRVIATGDERQLRFQRDSAG